MSTRTAYLKQVARIYAGANIKSGDRAFGEQGCPWVMVENLKDTYVADTDISRRLTKEGETYARLAPPGTVFFSRTGTIGKVGISSAEMAPSNNIFALEFNRDYVDPLYGMYCLLAFRKELQAEAKGSVYASLSLNAFRDFRIPVPELPVQRKIAEKLDTLCQARQVQQRIADTVKKTLHGVFDRTFTEQINRGFPKEGSFYLEECAEILFTGAAKQETKGAKQVRYISTGMLEDWTISCGKAPCVFVEPDTEERFLLKPGDIVMNRINQPERLGRCGYIDTALEVKERPVFGLNTVRIRAYEERIEAAFLFAWLTHPFIKRYVQQNAKNSTSFQSSLLKQAFTRLPVPAVALEKQKAFARKMEKYFLYTRKAAEQMETLDELRQLWYGRLRLLREEGAPLFGEEKEEPLPGGNRQYWTAPSGTDCFYDAYLECIQIPASESRKIKVSQLPLRVELQFLDEIRGAWESGYGSLEHVRLYRQDERNLRVIWMKPVRYQNGRDGQEKNGEEQEGKEEKEEKNQEGRMQESALDDRRGSGLTRAEAENSGDGGTEPEQRKRRAAGGAGREQEQLEEEGLISEQQDFGYLRFGRTYAVSGEEEAALFLKKPAPFGEGSYARLARLPMSARRFIEKLSLFQQAVYEEFLLAMQPLACHMAQKHLEARAGKKRFLGHGIQDVTATVRMLAHAGLLEQRQGFYLSYYKDYGQGEERELILDHRGRPVPIDTWVWAEPEE